VGSGVSVVLADADRASGLADMLQQYLQQTVESSTDKARAAGRIRGGVTVCAAEDAEVRVRVEFEGARIAIADADRAAPPSITGDFLSVAHLLSGEENAGALLIRRRIAVRCGLADVWLLWRVAGLLRIEARPAWQRAAPAVLLVVLAATTVWLVFR
jgi:hypothetical protein